MSTHPTTLTRVPLTGAALYADVTCPACHLASLRTDLLVAAGLDVPEWGFVEQRPAVRVAAITPDDETQAARERELAAVLAEVVAWTGNLVSICGGAITEAGERLVRRWRQERAALQAPACLTLLTATGEVLSGAAALAPLMLPDQLLPAAAARETEEPPLAATG